MDRLQAWGALALLTAVVGAATAADPGDSYPGNIDRGQLAFNRWNAGKVDPPKPPPVPPQVAAAKAKARDTAAALRAQEDANLLRRVAACDRLRMLAVETGDDSLEILADELQKKADAVYKQRTEIIMAERNLANDARATASSKKEGKK